MMFSQCYSLSMLLLHPLPLRLRKQINCLLVYNITELYITVSLSSIAARLSVIISS